jgi:hypothetical protein
VNLLLRLVSAGGWLANMLNQASGFRGPNIGHDESVKPRMLWAWIGCLAIVGIALVADMTRVPNAASAVGAVVTLAAAVLMWAGWNAGLVPFREDRAAAAEGGPAPGAMVATPSAAAAEPIAVHVTGVVEDEDRKPRLFRHRPARLEGGRLDVEGLDGGGRQEIVPVRPDFGLEAIMNPVPGTAWLVSGGRPAIRLERHAGRVLLAFNDAATRDAVLARTDGGDWPARPTDE